MPETALWLLVGTFVAVLLIGAGVWVLVERLKALREEARSLATLASLEKQVARLIEARDALDLRRIEHLLVDLRDAQLRTEQVLQRAEESRARGSDGAALVPVAPPSIAERVVNRLLALGFERVEVVSRSETLAALSERDGEVWIEARRDGLLHKGRVRIAGGQIGAVELQPATAIFP